MLREQAKIMSSLLAVLDLLIVATVHMYVGQHFHPRNVQDMFSSLSFLYTPCVFFLVLYHSGAYRSFRVSALREEVLLLARALLIGGAFLLGISWSTPQSVPQRTEFAVFLILLYTALCAGHLGLRFALRLARSHGFNVRYFLIVGDGLRALQVREELVAQSYW